MFDPVANCSSSPAETARRGGFQRRRRFHRAGACAGEAAPQIRRPAADARRSRPAGRERRVEPALRAAGARLARAVRRAEGEHPHVARRVARSRRARRALRNSCRRRMQPGEVLVTAQHRDDQVETLLLQLFRGAGVAGLAAMPAIAPFGPGRIARPLLDVSPRRHRSVGAQGRKPAWIEDPSNADTRFSRNFLRQRLMPIIREHWPGVDRALARSATHMAEAAHCSTSGRQRDLARLADGAGLSVSALRALAHGAPTQCAARLHRAPGRGDAGSVAP